MDKFLVHLIAAKLTQIALGNKPDVAISADISDASVRARNLQVWETHRIFYRALVQAFADESNNGWPSPSINMSGFLGSLGSGLVGLFTGGGPLASILGQLPSWLSSLIQGLGPVLNPPAPAPTPTTAPTTPLPAPKMLPDPGLLPPPLH